MNSGFGAVKYLQFVLSIAPGASVRVIPDLYSLDVESLLLPKVLGNRPNIRILHLPDLHLSIWDTFDLTKSLPLLTDLMTKVPTLSFPT
ncbi:hypothetical protein GGI21_005762 [Coemansia aciculifera]|nr:hypothetical protein GGI21_005762 [Coemansia aciculifera]